MDAESTPPGGAIDLIEKIAAQLEEESAAVAASPDGQKDFDRGLSQGLRRAAGRARMVAATLRRNGPPNA